MFHKLITFIKLSLKMKILMIQVFSSVVVLRVVLNRLPFKIWWRRLRRYGDKEGRFLISYNKHQIVRAVHLTARYLLKKRPCLVQAIVLWMFFRRRGYDAELKIGVNRENGDEFLAHAWVVSDGQVVIGHLQDLDSYREFDSLDTSDKPLHRKVV